MSAQSLIRWTVALLVLAFFCPLVLAQPNRPAQPRPPMQPFPKPANRPISPGPTGPNDGDAAPACAACGGMVVFFVILGLISIVSTIVWIFVVIWVANDAKARGMDNSAMWVVLVLFLGVLGLIIYIVSRPQGDVKTCRECGKKRLRELKRCPHCRFA